MTTPFTSYFRPAATLLAGSLILAILAAWRADRRDRAQLAADLASANQALTQADARQHAREAQLQQALAALAARKRAVTKPAQILRELPKQIPLPTPIRLQDTSPTGDVRKPRCSSGPPAQAGPVCGPKDLEPTPSSRNEASKAEPRQTGPPPSQALLATADLKPLYDFALDCQACQAKLTAAQGDLSDERAKTALLTKERDEALRTAKGGSALRRAARAAKWFLIGAAAGLAASRAAH